MAILDHDGIASTTGEGLLVEGGDSAVTPGTVFQACSLSKPAAALAVLRMAEQGRVDLDRDINRQLRGWRLPQGQGVTPRLLLCHAAGVSQPGFPGYAPGVRPPALPDILDGTPPANHPPIRVVHPPASAWAYSGGGYCLLQLLVEESMGMPFDQAMEELVFAPLGMRGRYALPPEPLQAWGHDAKLRPHPGGGNVYPELAAAGLWCAPVDMARLGLALLRGLRNEAGPVSRVAARWMANPATPSLSSWTLGLKRVQVGTEPALIHPGANLGFRTVLLLLPARQAGIVVMTNGDAGEAVYDDLVSAWLATHGLSSTIPASALGMGAW